MQVCGDQEEAEVPGQVEGRDCDAGEFAKPDAWVDNSYVGEVGALDVRSCWGEITVFNTFEFGGQGC